MVVPLGARQKLLGVVDLAIVNVSLLASLRFSAGLPFAWSTVRGHWYWFAVLSGVWTVIANAGDNYNSGAP